MFLFFLQHTTHLLSPPAAEALLGDYRAQVTGSDFRQGRHRLDDSYFYQLSLVLATATVSFAQFWPWPALRVNTTCRYSPRVRASSWRRSRKRFRRAPQTTSSGSILSTTCGFTLQIRRCSRPWTWKITIFVLCSSGSLSSRFLMRFRRDGRLVRAAKRRLE